jgi:4-hydroxybenzoate polyprenyltransferase
MKTIITIYGIKGTKYLITGFVLLHFFTATLFLKELGVIAHYGLLAGSNLYLWKEKSQGIGMKIRPLFHLTLAYMRFLSSLILDIKLASSQLQAKIKN